MINACNNHKEDDIVTRIPEYYIEHGREYLLCGATPFLPVRIKK